MDSGECNINGLYLVDYDSDGDGLLDNWERQYFGDLSQTGSSDFDGDGFSNFQEYQNGTDPKDFFNAALPILEIVNTNYQILSVADYLAVSLNVQATDTNGVPLYNAPLTFAVSEGTMQFSASANGALSTNLLLRTDANGFALVWLFLPTNSFVTNLMTVTAASGTNQLQMQLAVGLNDVNGPFFVVQTLPEFPPLPVAEAAKAVWLNYADMPHLVTPGGGGTNDPNSILPWLVDPMELANGQPANVDTTEALRQTNLLDLAAEFQSKNDALFQAATNSGIPTEMILPGGERVILSSIVEGHANWMMSDSRTQAVGIATADIWPGGSTGYNLNGTNTTMGLWEIGTPRTTHQEFQSRVVQKDGASALDGHATAVAGVLGAAGLVNIVFPAGVTNYQGAKGMSYAAPIWAYDYHNDLSEMSSVTATNDMKISNHSYSQQGGWYLSGTNWIWFGNTNVSQTEDWMFGAYDTIAADVDATVYTARTHLPVWTPGDSRNEGPSVQPTNHYIYSNGTPFLVTGVTRPLDGDTNGYDTIQSPGTAKNVLTVGAVSNLYSGYTGTSSVSVATFTPFGPTDDGRIKPDVVAPGVDVWLTWANSDANYNRFSGTSFAAPAVSGSINLLNQLRTSLQPNARAWLASTAKGLVIHTADEAGGSLGPDYQSGWGLMNTRTAADLINNNATNGWKSFIKEVFLTNGSSIEFPAQGITNQSLKVTICWTDPAGVAQTNVVDSPTARLMNDLDLRVVSPGGTTNFPWVLNPDLTNKTAAARSAAATTGDDTRNNVEQVVITNVVAGNYLVRVTHKGSLGTNGQWVSLLLSGVQGQSKPPLIITRPALTGSNKLAFAWPSVVGQLYQVQYVNNLEGASWSNWDGEVSAVKTNTAVEVDLTGPNGRRFYRVLEVE